MFYLELNQLGHKFIDCAKTTKWSEERYISYLYAGRCHEDRCVEMWTEAFGIDPYRKEAPCELMNYYNIVNNSEMVEHWWTEFNNKTISKASLFVEDICKEIGPEIYRKHNVA